MSASGLENHGWLWSDDRSAFVWLVHCGLGGVPSLRSGHQSAKVLFSAGRL